MNVWILTATEAYGDTVIVGVYTDLAAAQDAASHTAHPRTRQPLRWTCTPGFAHEAYARRVAYEIHEEPLQSASRPSRPPTKEQAPTP